MKPFYAVPALSFILIVPIIAGCGGGDNASPSQIQAALADAGFLNDAGLLPDGAVIPADAGAGTLYGIGGTVTGLQGSGLVLEADGVEDLTVTPSGGPVSFTFTTQVPTGTGYSVVVKTQPTNPSQTCTASSNTGTVAGAAVSNIAISCSTNTYTVGGTITGLTGTGLTLLDNDGDQLNVDPGATSFTFATPLADGSSFAVTVAGDPAGPAQVCNVLNGSDMGKVAGGNVTSVQIECDTRSFKVGGTATGVLGTGMVLQNNGRDDLTVNSSGAFTFATSILSGAKYAVTLKTPPGGPSQTCTVTNGSGTVGNAAVTSVGVTCSNPSFTVGGRVTGLVNGGLVLSSAGQGTLSVDSDGSFTFPATTSGSPYSVTVNTQPPGQNCTVTNGSGVVKSNVSNIQVTCSTTAFTVGGSVVGLGGHPVVLLDNGGDPVTIRADGSFVFPTALQDGSTYAVTVGTQPSNSTCSVISGGSGTIATADVTDVVVKCVTPVGQVVFDDPYFCFGGPAPIIGGAPVKGECGWTVPDNVTSVSVVVVGAGGGTHRSARPSGGGGGGELCYGTMAVTPGTVMSITVGRYGVGGAGNGGDSSFDIMTAHGGHAPDTCEDCQEWLAPGGKGGTGGTVGTCFPGGDGGSFIGDTSIEGGDSYLGGGGGAGGYAGPGGKGGDASNNSCPNNATAGKGGGGGGGGSASDRNASGTDGIGGGGGGVGLLGLGASGAAGASYCFTGLEGTSYAAGYPGTGGSGGLTSTLYTDCEPVGTPVGGPFQYGACDSGYDQRGAGATYGGGAGRGHGGNGAIRIIWGPGRSYPSTNTQDM